MNDEQDDREGSETLGILGRAMARARAQARATGEEPPPTPALPRAKPPDEARRALKEPACDLLGVVAGADGVFADGRFYPHRDILEVRHESREHEAWSYGDVGEGKTTSWSLAVVLRSGREVQLTGEHETGRGARHVHTLAYTLESTQKAWCALQGEPPPDLDPLARGSQSTLEWLTSLRRLGGTTSGPYRAAPADLDHLSQILDNVCAHPWCRAAAALVLLSSGDQTAAQRLREAAATLANPTTRTALLNIADLADDASLAAALDRLDPSLQRPTAAPLEAVDFDLGDGPP